MRLLPYGERALLAEMDDLDEVLDLDRRLRAAALPGIEETVPAARTLLLVFDPSQTDGPELARQVSRIGQEAVDAEPRMSGHPPGEGTVDVEPVELPVHYDGADLAAVAQLCGTSVSAVIERHAHALYTVAFCGFSPGFAYLQGLDPALTVPRRSSPRTRVRAGSVAIADRWTAVYPAASPGGWHILGHTDAPVWQLNRDPPTLLEPGARVRFRSVP